MYVCIEYIVFHEHILQYIYIHYVENIIVCKLKFKKNIYKKESLQR